MNGMNSTPGMRGAKGCAVGELMGGGDGAHGAAVEAVVEREEAGAEVAAFGAQSFRRGRGRA